MNVAQEAAIHFRSTANQARFILLRNQLKSTPDQPQIREEMRETLKAEIELARQLYGIQARDSRIGFEATNHYFYVPQDLLEKIVNCHHLLAQLEQEEP